MTGDQRNRIWSETMKRIPVLALAAGMAAVVDQVPLVPHDESAVHFLPEGLE